MEDRTARGMAKISHINAGKRLDGLSRYHGNRLSSAVEEFEGEG